MNRVDDITIERYLDGGMDPAEQAAFKAQLASDASLRRRVASEESMMRALRADRNSARRDHAELRSRVLASIPVIAPASAVTTRPAVRRGLYWPFIATIAIVAGWVAIDIAMPDAPPAAPPGAPRRSTPPGTEIRTTDGAGTVERPRSISAQGAAPEVGDASAPRSGVKQRTAPALRSTADQRSTTARRSSTSERTIRARPATPASVDGGAPLAPASRREIPRRVDSVARTSVSIAPK